MSQAVMWHSVDCAKLAEWLEALHRLHLETPKVPIDQVTRDPVEAVYGAVRELQDKIGNLKWEICKTINGPHRQFFTFNETLESLRPSTGFLEPPQAAVVAGESALPERCLTPAAGEMP